MEYCFDQETFVSNFNVKPEDENNSDSARLTHFPDKKFKLFPYKASGKGGAPIVEDLTEVISMFIQLALGREAPSVPFEELYKSIVDNIDIDEDDKSYLFNLLRRFFFVDDVFCAQNIGLYPYQAKSNNRSAERVAFFLYSVLGVDDNLKKVIEEAISDYPYNVLERMIIDFIGNYEKVSSSYEKKYYPIIESVQTKFKNDLTFMLQSGLSSPEDLSCLLSLYYFNYMSQTCLTLEQFCNGKRENHVPLFFALDWEKVSTNRRCCKDGWESLQNAVSHIFCHAITLELLNQHLSEEMFDYIDIANMANESEESDRKIAETIRLIEKSYTDCIRDYKRFDEIVVADANLQTDVAIRHLFKCVEEQFLNTERKRANQFYIEKFEVFCRARWLKNRRKSGVVLNLTERDVIFLTKLCIGDSEKIRLNDLYKEYESRGIYLDITSREYLQEFFTKLNLIDKKSDSGDAQYVKRFL